MEFILATRIEDVLAAAIPGLAERLGATANIRIAEPPRDGNGRQETPRARRPRATVRRLRSTAFANVSAAPLGTGTPKRWLAPAINSRFPVRS